MIFLSNPRRNLLRTGVVAMAIAASISLVLILSGLSIGVRHSSRRSLDDIGVDLYVVPEDLHPLLTDLQRFDQGWSVQREIEGTEFKPDSISPRLLDALFYRTDDELGEVQVHGVDPNMEKDFDQFRIIEGNWFQNGNDPVRDESIENGLKNENLMTLEVLLSDSFMEYIGLKVGDRLSMTPSLTNGKEYDFLIKGIYVDSLSRLSRSAMIHLGELQLLKGLLEKDTLTEILIGYEEDESCTKLVEWSRSDDFSFRDIVDVVSKEDVLRDIQDFLVIIDGFALMVTGLTLVICLIFTSSIFMISIKEKSVDIAVLRAIGIPSLRITSWLVMESIFLYTIGSLLGLITGGSSILILNEILKGYFSVLPQGFTLFRLDPAIIIIVFFLSFVLSVLSTLLPVYKVMRKPPMQSLRGVVV